MAAKMRKFVGTFCEILGKFNFFLPVGVQITNYLAPSHCLDPSHLAGLQPVGLLLADNSFL